MKNTFNNKPLVGDRAHRQAVAQSLHKKAVKQVQEKNEGKRSVYVPELKMAILVGPDADLAAIIAKHREVKEWRSKKLTH